MNQGKLLASGPVDEVRRSLGRAERTLTVEVLERGDAAADWLWNQTGVSELVRTENRLAFKFAGSTHISMPHDAYRIWQAAEDLGLHA